MGHLQHHTERQRLLVQRLPGGSVPPARIYLRIRPGRGARHGLCLPARTAPTLPALRGDLVHDLGPPGSDRGGHHSVARIGGQVGRRRGKWRSFFTYLFYAEIVFYVVLWM